MKKNVLLIFGFLFLLSNNVFSAIEIRQLNKFHTVIVSHKIDVELIHSDKNSAKVRTNQSLSDVITEVKNSVLYIKMKDKKGYKNIETSVRLSFENLETLIVKSSSEVRASELITLPTLRIEARNSSLVELDLKLVSSEIIASGNAKLDLNIEADNLKSDCSSKSAIELDGNCSEMNVKVGSASLFNSLSCKTKSMKIVASSGSKAIINVEDQLDMYSGSGSDIQYRGDPQISGSKTESGGKISKL